MCTRREKSQSIDRNDILYIPIACAVTPIGWYTKFWIYAFECQYRDENMSGRELRLRIILPKMFGTDKGPCHEESGVAAKWCRPGLASER